MRFNEIQNQTLEEALSRRGFLGGLLGAAAGSAFGAQKTTPQPAVKQPTSAQNRPAVAAPVKSTPSAPAAAQPVVQKYTPALLKDQLLKYAQKHLPRNQIAEFMAHMDHESHGFRSMSENLNYSAEILNRNNPKTFPIDYANRVVAHPNKEAIIANMLYSNRSGNGDYASGDGYRYRGRGYIQLTGRENYARYSKAAEVDLVNNPDLAARPDIAAKVAVAYWKTRVKNPNNIASVTKNIAGNASQGIKSRMEKLKKYKRELGSKKK